ncbi:MAG TPA: hypothetical protein VJR89_12525, partial [Polyangiales bacterium]|nr:hypothetical protein [Polyangiales bacterium]
MNRSRWLWLFMVLGATGACGDDGEIEQPETGAGSGGSATGAGTGAQPAAGSAAGGSGGSTPAAGSGGSKPAG